MTWRGRLVGAFSLVVLTAGCAANANEGESSDEAVAPTTDTPAAITVPRPEKGPLRVLFVGDSLSDGSYVSHKGLGFTERLMTAWRQDGPVRSLRAVESGARTWRIAKLATQRGSDLAVIEVGSNDVGISSPEDFETELTHLVADVEKRNRGVQVVCLGTWGEADDIAPYDEALERVCSGDTRTYASLADIFPQPALRGPSGEVTPYGTRDGFHPNDAGHAAIADAVEQMVTLT